MANKQQTLQTNIILGGKVSKSFDQIGTKLEEVGTTVNKVSQLLISAGKEGVQTYMEYEEAMKEIASLQEYNYSDLEQLHELNKETAQSTIYTNTELANAELLLAQAGLKVEEVTKVLPSTLRLATAGNLDMADSVDYLVSSLNSLGLTMDYADTLTDQMAKTAALGMTDIDTLGESLTRLGSAAGQYFKGGSSEILTILSAMSQFGKDMRGSEAGTQLRNFAISLAAPASNVEEMADAMRELGYAEEEVEEYVNGRSNGQAVRAIETLKEAGLQIYDANDELLPMIDIIKSLRNAVYGSSAYTEDLSEFGEAFAKTGSDVDAFVESTEGLSDNALFTLMTQIFGKRTATTALNLISISDEEWDSTLQEIEDSEGYAQNAADIMQGGLTGSLKQLETAFTELKTTLGEHLAPDVENVANFLHDIVTDISNFDGDTWDLLISGAEVIAGAGPAILIASGAFKALAAVMSPGTAAALGIVGLAAAVNMLAELDWQQFQDEFGDLDVSSDELSQYIESLGDSFYDAYTDVNNFAGAVSTATTNYKTASSEFKTDLISAMLTSTSLTDEDITSLEELGGSMYNAIVDGINNATARDMAAITQTFGGEGVAEENGIWASIIEVLNIGYTAAIAQATDLSQQLRDAMTSAFEDKTLTGEEVQNIQSIMDDMNQLMAIQTNAENYASQQSMLRKAQTMGLDSLQSISAEELARQQEVMNELYESQSTSYGTLAAYLDYMVENGLEYTDENGQKFTMTREYADEMLKTLSDQQASEAANYHLKFLPFTWDLYNQAISESDLSGAWTGLQSFADSALASGTVTEADLQTYQKFSTTDRDRIATYMGWLIEAMGGADAIQNDIETLLESGDTATANQLKRILQMDELATYAQMNADLGTSGYATETALGSEYTAAELRSMLDNNADSMTGIALEALKDAIETGNFLNFEDMMTNMGITDTGFRSGIESVTELAKSLEGYDSIEVPSNLQSISDYYRMYKMLYPEQLVSVTDNGEGEELRSELEQTFSEPIKQNVWITYGSTDSFGLTSVSRRTMNAYSKYAEGGRADTASIFGEAGAEWAIPEEHSTRTAELLDAARAASGFTWPELLSMSGGLNAGGSKSVTLAYSPTIYATDAADVETKLIQDKSRMERWLRERELRREVEVYS